jgi:hypothetical protein
VWLVVDLFLVSVFAVVGRLSHYGSLSLAGWWTTAWPFLAGALLARTALLVGRHPAGAIGSGVVMWLGSLLGGLLLRQVSGQGTATPFVVVATLTLGVLLVLPRAVVALTRRSGSVRSRVGPHRPPG